MLRLHSALILPRTVFQDLATQMTGAPLPLADTPDADGDLILIGTDADNPLLANAVLDGSLVMPPCRHGSDDFFLRTCKHRNRTR